MHLIYIHLLGLDVMSVLYDVPRLYDAYGLNYQSRLDDKLRLYDTSSYMARSG